VIGRDCCFVSSLVGWFVRSLTLGTCGASSFYSNSNRPSDSILFESDWPIRKFSNRIGRACFIARRKLSHTTETINGT